MRFSRLLISVNKTNHITDKLTIKAAEGTKPVIVNGKAARASYDVKIGDLIEITFGTREFKAEVVSVAETVKKVNTDFRIDLFVS